MFGIEIEHLLASGGILLVAAIVFAESGLLIGFFLPGDTLLFSAGFFAAQGKLPIIWLLLTAVLAAIIGDNVGYTIGRKAGPRLFKKKDGILFRQEYLERSERFYERHGGKTITLARFVPIIRTFAPIVAGMGKMERRRFMYFNVIGASIWVFGVTLLGYFLGDIIPNIDKYLLPAVGIATLFTFGPPIVHVIKDAKTRRRLVESLSATSRRAWRYLRLNKAD